MRQILFSLIGLVVLNMVSANSGEAAAPRAQLADAQAGLDFSIDPSTGRPTFN